MFLLCSAWSDSSELASAPPGAAHASPSLPAPSIGGEQSLQGASSLDAGED